jgi:hypothetical protein
MAGGVLASPVHRCRTVAEEIRETHLRVQAIVGNHGDEPARGERFAGEHVIGALTGVPVAAVEEHDDRRCVDGSCRLIHVEHVTVVIAVGDGARAPVGVRRHQRVHEAERRTAAQAHGAPGKHRAQKSTAQHEKA